jgi:hypothetical protein
MAFLSGVTPLHDALRTARLVGMENRVSIWFIQDAAAAQAGLLASSFSSSS